MLVILTAFVGSLLVATQATVEVNSKNGFSFLVIGTSK
jgi:hypothetical protein